MNIEKIYKELKRIGMERIKADKLHKMWGKCDTCQFETVLSKESGMCGPCTFGEAETINGNWP